MLKLFATTAVSLIVSAAAACGPTPTSTPPSTTVPMGSADLGDPSYVNAQSVDDIYYFGDSLGAMSRELNVAIMLFKILR